jgi:hypothetical protein
MLLAAWWLVTESRSHSPRSVLYSHHCRTLNIFQKRIPSVRFCPVTLSQASLANSMLQSSPEVSTNMIASLQIANRTAATRTWVCVPLAPGAAVRTSTAGTPKTPKHAQ